MSVSYDPRFRLLVDWVEERRDGLTDRPVPFDDSESVDAVRWIAAFLDTAKVLPLPEPPAALRGRLRAAFVLHRTPEAPADLDGEKLALVRDSRRDRELVGVRGTQSPLDSRFQLSFRGDAAVVLVEVQRTAASGINLTGQVIPNIGDSQVYTVRARRLSDADQFTESNAEGEFLLTELPVDAMVIEVTDGNLHLQFEVDLRHS